MMAAAAMLCNASTCPMTASSGFERSRNVLHQAMCPTLHLRSAWQSKSPAFDVYCFVVIDFVVAHNHSLRPCYGPYQIKPSYIIVYLYILSLFVCYGRPPLTMDVVSAAIFDGGRAISQKHEKL
jgi:hypothetical protein